MLFVHLAYFSTDLTVLASVGTSRIGLSRALYAHTKIVYAGNMCIVHTKECHIF